MNTEHLAARPPSAGALVFGLLAALAAALLLASQLGFAKRQYADGLLQPLGGELRVLAPQAGTLHWRVAAGAAVRQGEMLASIAAPDALSDGSSASQRKLSALADERHSLAEEAARSEPSWARRLQALQREKTLGETQARQAEDEVRALEELLRLDTAELQRQRSLQEQGFVSRVALEHAQAAIASRRRELLAAQRLVAQARAQAQSAAADLSEAEVLHHTQRESLRRSAQGLDQTATEIEQQAATTVPAPGDGALATQAVGDGDAVAAGQLLGKLEPRDAPLEALLLLPPETLGRVQMGQQVRLELSAYPYQTYGLVRAVIVALDRTPVLAGETRLKALGVAPDAFVVVARARIAGDSRAITTAMLRPGMRLRAAIEVERRSLLAWMVRPLSRYFE